MTTALFKVLARIVYWQTKSKEGFSQGSRCPTDTQTDFLQNKSVNSYLLSQLSRRMVGKRVE